MAAPHADAPDSTAVRVALWRAQHIFVDAPPHVLADDVGLKLAAPDEGWLQRPDMDATRTRSFRAAIVARARFIEDLVVEQGAGQYVILGAGLDSFAQRRPELMSRLTVFEIDQPGTQSWKQRRLKECGYALPPSLRFVPVDFEAGESWVQKLITNGFDKTKPTVVVSTGVSMYLTKDAVTATLREVAQLAPGSTFAMTFMLPIELVSDSVRIGMEFAMKGAAASGTPFISFFSPEEITGLARTAGFKDARVVTGDDLTARYFANRPDGLRPPGRAEELLVAST